MKLEKGKKPLNLKKKTTALLMQIYQAMFDKLGPRNWWPAETPFEVIIGAILTQSVSWGNVEKAIENLKKQGLLNPHQLVLADDEVLEEAVRPTRYYKQKALRLKAFCTMLVEEYGGDLDLLFALDLPVLRRRLLQIKGIGPETADSIILYAAEKPIFVVDAYTRRIFSRLGIFPEDIDYQSMQDFFMKHLPPDVELYNEYHALIDGVGNRYCAAQKPKCGECPLHELCKSAFKLN